MRMRAAGVAATARASRASRVRVRLLLLLLLPGEAMAARREERGTQVDGGGEGKGSVLVSMMGDGTADRWFRIS